MKRMVAIVGGGAAGMVAAVQAAEHGADVVLVEHNDALGKKLLATGNGRCNFSNSKLSSSAYNCISSVHGAFVDTAFDSFGLWQTLSFFAELGLHASSEDGRLYPRSQQGATLRDLLLLRLEQLQQSLQLRVLLNSNVQRIRKTSKGWALLLQGQEGQSDLQVSTLILAPGGLAGSQFGSDGSILALLQSMGIVVQPVMPALVPLTLELQGFTRLYGVRCPDCHVQLLVEGSAVAKERGEIHWSRHALSGIPILDLSGSANLALSKGSRTALEIDLLPEISRETLLRTVKSWTDKDADTGQRFLSGLVHTKLALLLVELARVQKTMAFEDKLVEMLKAWVIPVQGSLGYREAQATLGGVDLRQLDARTMSVRHEPSLFFAGEVVDVVGKCGGYNLQWAWSSGAIAGRNAAQHV